MVEPMLGVAVLVAGAVLAAIMAAARRQVDRDQHAAVRHRDGSDARLVPEALLIPDDLAELDAAFVVISAENVPTLSVLLAARLQPLVARKVPIRGVRPASAPRTVRVHFADGTVVHARGLRAGDMGVLAQEALRHTVRLTGISHETGQTQLVFSGSHIRHPISAIALGLDQPE